MTKPSQSIFTRSIVFGAIGDSFLKLDPRTLFRNPVIFIVEIGSVVTTAIFFHDLAPPATASRSGSQERSRSGSG